MVFFQAFREELLKRHFPRPLLLLASVGLLRGFLKSYH